MLLHWHSPSRYPLTDLRNLTPITCLKDSGRGKGAHLHHNGTMSDHLTFGARRGKPDPNVVDGSPPTPPEPPLQDKLWRFYRHQVVAIPLMMLIVLAALFGLFGFTEQRLIASSPELMVEIEAVERFRYRMTGPFDVTVTNPSDRPVESVTLRISRRYLTGFSGVSFSPSASHIDGRWWTFDLGDIAPGATRVLTGELRAESSGSLTGHVEVATGDRRVAVVSVETFAFP